jgi:hypothetical protein
MQALEPYTRLENETNPPLMRARFGSYSSHTTELHHSPETSPSQSQSHFTPNRHVTSPEPPPSTEPDQSPGVNAKLLGEAPLSPVEAHRQTLFDSGFLPLHRPKIDLPQILHCQYHIWRQSGRVHSSSSTRALCSLAAAMPTRLLSRTARSLLLAPTTWLVLTPAAP